MAERRVVRADRGRLRWTRGLHKRTGTDRGRLGQIGGLDGRPMADRGKPG